MDDKMLKCKYLMLKNTRNKQPTNNKEIGISKKYSKVYQLLEPAIVFNFSWFELTIDKEAWDCESIFEKAGDDDQNNFVCHNNTVVMRSGAEKENSVFCNVVGPSLSVVCQLWPHQVTLCSLPILRTPVSTSSDSACCHREAAAECGAEQYQWCGSSLGRVQYFISRVLECTDPTPQEAELCWSLECGSSLSPLVQPRSWSLLSLSVTHSHQLQHQHHQPLAPHIISHQH